MTGRTSHVGYEPSASSPLFLLAMDHRESFGRTLFGVVGEPTSEQIAQMRSAKLVIYEGARGAVGDGLVEGRVGVLVDEHLGADVARQVRADHVILAMPIEKSGTELFELEYGEGFREHVDAFNPDFFKVLVRYNPDDDESARSTQVERLAQVSSWAEEAGRRWLFELLVPATRDQLARYEDQYHFDQAARPALTATTINSFTKSGVHPTLWKLEGYETTEGAQRVLEAIANDTGHHADCLILGRNAPLERVEHWIDVAAVLPGFVGFAVGRSIWEEPLRAMINDDRSRDVTVREIARRYRELIDTYSATHEGHAVVAP